MALEPDPQCLPCLLKQHRKEPRLPLLCSHFPPPPPRLLCSALITLASLCFVNRPNTFPPGMTALFSLFTSPFKCHFLQKCLHGPACLNESFPSLFISSDYFIIFITLFTIWAHLVHYLFTGLLSSFPFSIRSSRRAGTFFSLSSCS